MKPAKKTSPASKPGRKRVDKEAVERDYRTGTMTLRELGAKHNANHATIGRWAESGGWTKDLSAAIRQATNAKLIEDATRQSCDGARQDATTAVLVAAEVNTQIILGHRKLAVQAREAMDLARAKLLSLGDTVADIRDAATFVSATESLSRTTKTVIDIQRTAFGLDDAPKEKDKPAAVDWASKSADEGMAAYMRLVHGQ